MCSCECRPGRARRLRNSRGRSKATHLMISTLIWCPHSDSYASKRCVVCASAANFFCIWRELESLCSWITILAIFPFSAAQCFLFWLGNINYVNICRKYNICKWWIVFCNYTIHQWCNIPPYFLWICCFSASGNK